MGGSPTKPEFVSVLADKQVREGHEVTLHCEANTEEVTATWEKNGHRLECVAGKHKIDQSGAIFKLTIRDAAKEDEGNYKLTLSNDAGSESRYAMVTVELKEWRTVEWKQNPLVMRLNDYKISDDTVRQLRFLLHGPVGAGKSSIINTIKSIFDGHQFINCLAASDLSGESFTKKYQKFSFGTLPFAFYDVMGLEMDEAPTKFPFMLFHPVSETEGQKETIKTLKGAHQDDIINALKGHIRDDYEFQTSSMGKESEYYVHNPTLNDKIHCLVSVIAADKVTLMSNEVIKKMKNIRAEASKLGIPQLVFMTRVDMSCQLTQKDLTKIYQSKKVKEKMEECSVRLGVPMNCIFPLKNYHEEANMNEKLNCLMLEAFTQAVHSAHDYVKNISHHEKRVE